MDQRPAPSAEHGRALLALYDSALPQVYGYLVSRCGSAAVAEDLCSETFVATVDAVRRDDVPTMTTAWLIGVARHKLVDHWRRADREQRLLRAVDAVGPATDDPWDVHLDVVLAHQTLALLTPMQRSVLTLRYLDGLPVPEIAVVLDRTIGATELLLVRARRAFRHHYEHSEEDR